MSPYPLEAPRAIGPMRIVITTYSTWGAAVAAAETVLRAKLAACANVVPTHSLYWWRGGLEAADEALVLFKTSPKRVGGLVRHLETTHPYEVPEVAEVDVPRVGAAYLRYLTETLEPTGAIPPGRRAATRSGARRGRGARSPRRTRAPRRRRSR